MKYDCFLHDAKELEGKPIVVALSYQAFCDPCQAMKPHVEALAREHGFYLIRIDRGLDYSPERAGETLPQLAVYRDGVACPALSGARTKKDIVSYLTRYGVLQ